MSGLSVSVSTLQRVYSLVLDVPRILNPEPSGDQHTLCIRTVQYHKTIEEQHVFLLEQIKAISVNQICSTDGRQVVSLHVKAKWMETMTCSAQPLGILPDWFGRQLIGITPELFDEADKKQCKTLQLHYPPSCSPDSGTFGQH